MASFLGEDPKFYEVIEINNIQKSGREKSDVQPVDLALVSNTVT